ncbi:MAG: prephenate dehydrogenase [Anaerolineae bacterium]
MARITIVGLGLVGGSIGLGLHQAELKNLEVVGHDIDHGAARLARKLGAVDKTEWNLISACEGADLIIIATPVLAIKEIFTATAPYLKEGCVLSDTAGSKEQVLKWAAEILPDTVSFIGGDPMVGGDRVGLAEASADIFKGAVYCLTPLPTAKPQAVKLMTDLVTTLGATPYFLDAAEHDGLVAAVDHLPFALSAVLLSMVEGSSSRRELRKLAGPTFGTATHFSSVDPLIFRDLCLTNQESMLRWLDACQESLQVLRAAIAGGDSGELEALFTQALTARQSWLEGAREEVDELVSQSLRRPQLLGLGDLFGFRGGRRGED